MSTDTIITLTVTDEDFNRYKRLDQFICANIEEVSRNTAKKLFEEGKIISKTDNLVLKKMPSSGTIITIHIPAPQESRALAENIPLEIVYEDEHLLFVNKKAGMVVHPAPGNYTGTLVNAILHHCPDLKGIGDAIRPGIVHRLDKGTSGIMIVAKEQKCHQKLVEIFSNHDINRVYECLALTKKVTASGTLQSTIGRSPNHRQKMAANVKNGKHAITHYKVLEYFKNAAHIQLKLETGRTHQIRVHLSALINAPIINDPTYGNPKNHLQQLGPKIANILKNYEYPLLHAKSLGLTHPITKKYLEFTSDLPETFSNTLSVLQNEKNI